MAMHKVTAVLFIGLACFVAAEGSRTLLRSSSQAFASADSGSSSGQSVKKLLADAFAAAKANSDGKGSADAYASATAKEVGKLFAKAWANAAGSVNVDGTGSAQSRASASAQSLAQVYAEAISAAVSDAVAGLGGDASKAKTKADSSEVKNVIVSAVASAKIELNSEGGYATATVNAVADAVAKVVVEATADAFAFVYDRAAFSGVSTEAAVDVEDQSSAGVKTTANGAGNDISADASGVAEANVDAKNIGLCKNTKLAPCCQGKFHSQNGGKTYCLSNQYVKADFGGSVTIWKHIRNNNDVCRC